MRRLVALLPAVLLVMAPAIAHAQLDDADRAEAARALERLVKQLADGQAGQAYRSLHPAQKAFITKQAFIDCRSDKPDLEVDDIEVSDVVEETVTIPGTDVSAESAAITATISTNRGDQTDTFHLLKVGKKWRWAQGDAEAYLEGACP
jgi:hypothetical protein